MANEEYAQKTDIIQGIHLDRSITSRHSIGSHWPMAPLG